MVHFYTLRATRAANGPAGLLVAQGAHRRPAAPRGTARGTAHDDLYELKKEEGEDVEPVALWPTIPMLVVNGACPHV